MTEHITANLNLISDLYKEIAVLTEKRDKEEDWDARGAFTRAISGLEDAIDNLSYANKALEEC